MRQVQWLGQIQYGGTFPAPCSPSNPCPAGFQCVNGACQPVAPSPRVNQPLPKIDPRLIPQLQPVAPKKTDNTVFWVLGAAIGAGILYYAIQ